MGDPDLRTVVMSFGDGARYELRAGTEVADWDALTAHLWGLMEVPGMRPYELTEIAYQVGGGGLARVQASLDRGSSCPASARHDPGTGGWRIVYNPAGLRNWLQSRTAGLEEDEIDATLVFSLVHEIGHVVRGDAAPPGERRANHEIEYGADRVAQRFLLRGRGPGPVNLAALRALKKLSERATDLHPCSAYRASNLVQ